MISSRGVQQLGSSSPQIFRRLERGAAQQFFTTPGVRICCNREQKRFWEKQ